MKKLFLIGLWLGMMCFQCLAQDGHYSQYLSAPIYTNPALTGSENKGTRLGINYRSQWAKVADPYRNIGAYLDWRKKQWGIGIMVNQNDAGEASLQRNQVGLAFALHKTLAAGNSELALGGMIGVLQQRFDPLAFSYDEQYREQIGFDPSASSNEQFVQTSMILPDLNIGLRLKVDALPTAPKVGGEFGLSFAHLNRPGASFFNELVDYPTRVSVQAGLRFAVTSLFSVSPQVLWQKQSNASELLLRAMGDYRIQGEKYLRFGLGLRRADAVILYGGLQFANFQLGLSYDSTISGLKAVSRGNGAFEVSAIFYFQRDRSPKPKPLPQDRDGDGIIDTEDTCPNEAGELAYGGCPAPVNLAQRKSGRDIDGDGVLDENDLCPYQPGLARWQGCNDQDGDGIWDHADACPGLRGDPANYGCPSHQLTRDSDGDGVLDEVDNCVYIKGAARFGGCPDTDQDGIADHADHCPYLPGVPTRNGCPAEKDRIESRRISVEVVEFDTDKAIIKPGYAAMLDRVAYELRFNEDYRLQLEGHTDSEGDDLYNYNLSQRRVFAVQQYLMERGLAADRIAISYYGESRPKAGNAVETGRARNRRTELILLSQ